jgi:hypothetical protein
MNAQDALWYLPNALGHGWWYIVSGISAAALLTIFAYMIVNERFSRLLVARVLLAGSMLCFALVPLNSGWIPWGALLASLGCLHTAFMIATNWCERHDKWQRMREILTFSRHRTGHRSSD